MSTFTSTLMPTRNGGLPGCIVDEDAHRNALDDLDPVTAGILRRQQREARGGCRTYAVDRSVPSLARIGIDVDRDFLFGLDIGQFGLLRARLNPDVIGRNDVECDCRGGEILAGLQRRHIGHDAGEGGSHDGVGELACSLIARGHGILVFGMVFDRRIGIAIQVGGDAGQLLLQRGKLLLRTLEGIARGIEGGLRSEVVGDQLLLTLEVDHVEVDIFLRLLDLGLHVAVTGLKRNEIISRISDLSLGAIQRQLKLQRVQLEQDVALGDLLIVVNQDLRDDAGDVGRQPDHVGLDIRIIRRHHGAAGHIKVAAHDKRHRQQRKHQRAPH